MMFSYIHLCMAPETSLYYKLKFFTLVYTPKQLQVYHKYKSNNRNNRHWLGSTIFFLSVAHWVLPILSYLFLMNDQSPDS